MDSWKVSLFTLISTFSLALDLAENKKLEHAQRVAYLALRTGEKLGLAPDRLRLVFYGGLLHDIGKVNAQLPVESHPLAGARWSTQLPLLTEIAPIIAAHHEAWDGSGFPLGLSGEEIPIEAQLLFLADQIENQFGQDYDLLPVQERIVAFVEKEKGKRLAPVVADACLELLQEPRVYYDLAHRNLAQAIRRRSQVFDQEIQRASLKHLALLFADLVDAKSPYTAAHSRRVANTAFYLGQALGLPAAQCRQLYLAGLLHDLGKLAVPSAILDKPDQLTPQEYSRIIAHAYYTERLLMEIPGLEELAFWAAAHHEKLDGSGYPSRLRADQLPLPARILAVADYYQALADDRPYRAALPREKIYHLLRQEAVAGRFDARVVEALLNLF
ncbi:HD-GYP domain-containing protein [Carboxydocella sp. JDF658]|uniref:HD-GYP domain-containing protein n=1 Tax=Carboxydocella sp. JDF658 TaxID=1926600 RepID=UPI0009CF769F|nr:HD-GYP domain-containing protein [Carboxydocella sp. JDF658]GAW30879.1 diguanylate cyclase [Carboxydocella sp. JDF658]